MNRGNTIRTVFVVATLLVMLVVVYGCGDGLPSINGVRATEDEKACQQYIKNKQVLAGERVANRYDRYIACRAYIKEYGPGRWRNL